MFGKASYIDENRKKISNCRVLGNRRDYLSKFDEFNRELKRY